MATKCEATGKIRFDSTEQAKRCMSDFNVKWKMRWDGKRRKHRQGKPVQKRVYYCMDCDGYHLTSWNVYKPKDCFNQVSKQLIVCKSDKEL